ncbi:acetyl-CoA carboxylase biotin carboxyl carrier protein subunit [Minwuia thermotolerans]|jgi:acetyl-CoA carboxylase biotin carboxyl carrier protein|uniref:Acetyl-CoA carboxylase biotin carboxyl carrier protein subunit n=1 Tax=Minwuia thermotolerans TaxID=2056226 RepID=A0A2M9G3U6_9PROT|nr:acetyl-CoA carboxylase biotin carboxyl carrier protein subunit [Minwuia thermotolerans]ANK82954.1 MAG: acetyl-CoA carboxylase biotin carboxyl carrier protein subunit [Rhizobiales bacterium NRL2]PJK30399.1 acetyl-CoA carboxylase biotin carboxyl carrier protein subunit [Minwuia thermotolerans]
MAEIEIKSEIAGKVWQIEAEVGQSVDEDDPVVILESMKMEIPVGAPAAGKVTEILVAKDEAVAEGQTIARMET